MTELSIPELAIRKPDASCWPVCRMLLPNTMPHAIRYEYRIAADADMSAVAGAAAFTDNGLGLHTLQIHTVLDRRGKGVGKQLLNHVLQEAANRGRKEVSAVLSARGEPEFHGFLNRHGFTLRSQFSTAEGDLTDICRRQRERGSRVVQKSLADGRIVPLTSEMLRDAGRLIAAYLSDLEPAQSGAYFVPQHLAGIGLSQALVIDGVLQGVIIVTRQNDVAIFESRAVTPQFRNTRSSAALLLRSIEVAMQSGAKRARFSFGESARDTAAYVRRMNLQVIDTIDHLVAVTDKAADL
jgi:GNAT superfamily N-acetyltransferase